VEAVEITAALNFGEPHHSALLAATTGGNSKSFEQTTVKYYEREAAWLQVAIN
jgi:hypothetical protein